MPRVKTKVARLQHPPPVADHYFKLERRLRNWLGLDISLSVANYDPIDTCLGHAMLEYDLATTEFDRRVLVRELKAIVRSDSAIEKVIAFVGSKYDFERTLREEINTLVFAKLPRDFRKTYVGSKPQIEEVRKACAEVIDDLKALKAKAGRKSNEWYDPFVFGMWCIARWSGIGLSTQDRIGMKLRTPFLALVSAYEMCLPQYMRSGSREARAKRIQVSLQRMREKGWLKEPPKR